MTTIERNEGLTEMLEGLIEIAPGIYKMPLPKSLDRLAAYIENGIVIYNANFTGKLCETIKQFNNKMPAVNVAGASEEDAE